MADWEEQIRGVLNDPAQMAELSRLAQSLLGGETAEAPPEPQGLPGLDPALLGRAAGLLGSDPGESRGMGLLRAIEPYLAPQRRERLERARRLARMAKLAKLALGEGGGHGKAL